MAEEIPRYIANPLLRFIEYLKESMRLLHMSMRGISMITAIPNSLTVLGEHAYSETPPDDPVRRKEEFQKELEAAEAMARLAQKECKEGFPLLHAHALVGAWSALESAIEDSLLGMLLNEPDLLQSEPFARTRIPLAEFEALDKEERMRLLVEELERGQGLGKKQGVDGFELLLEQVKLSGPVDPEIKKTTWEIYHLRNVIVHRASVADRRLVQGCPWMGLKVGDKVYVSHKALGTYYDALYKYLMTIIRRAGLKYDVDIDRKIHGGAGSKSEGDGVLD